MATDLKTLIQKKRRDEAEKASAEAEKFEMIAEILANPELRKIVVEQLAIAQNTGPVFGPAFDKMKAFMISNGNRLAMLAQAIADGCKLSLSSVRRVMSKTKAFQNVSPEGQKDWQLQIKGYWKRQSQPELI